jgi:hypothetical protein
MHVPQFRGDVIAGSQNYRTPGNSSLKVSSHSLEIQLASLASIKGNLSSVSF